MRNLIVEHWGVAADGLVSSSHVEQTSHGEKKSAVFDGYLSILDSEGEIGGYAPGTWRRWWYESK